MSIDFPKERGKHDVFIVVEHLTFWSLLKVVLYVRLKNIKKEGLYLHYIEATTIIILILKYVRLIDVKKLSWHYKDINEKDGYSYGLKIEYEEIFLILSNVLNLENHTDCLLKEEKVYFEIYLKKELAARVWPGSTKSLIHILLMLYAIKYNAEKKEYNNEIILFTNKIAWMEIISEYAKDKCNIELIPINNNFYSRIHDKIKYKLISSHLFLKLYTLFKYRKVENILEDYEPYKNNIVLEIPLQSFPLLEKSKLNLKNVTIVNKEHKLGAVQNQYIKDFKRPFIYLSPYLSNDSFIPVFRPVLQKLKIKPVQENDSWESDLIWYYLLKFMHGIYFWEYLFRKLDTKLYVTLYLWSPHVIAAAAAIRKLGGVSVVLQNSFFEHASVNAIICCDIQLLFSNDNVFLEKTYESHVKYNVALGYFRDYTFSVYRKDAEKIRAKLLLNGAKKIISFFDQGSQNDSRWDMGHEVSKCGYKFLLKKVLEEEWLGLILKPKKPGILFNKLGEVASLLEEAISTGRCHIILSSDESLVKNFTSPPALIAMASDLAIHDTLVAGTAGVEAALTGTPTVFFDNYGFSKSLFCQPNDGKIVFNDWNYLWSNLGAHFTENPVPGLGDWSRIMDKIDPFNDGEAAERMGKYLSLLIQGFDQGFDRETILADAAKRYCRQWGNEKITEIKKL